MKEIVLEESWKSALQEEFSKPYFDKLRVFIKKEYAEQSIYPKGSNIFAALDACPLSQVKVVILGQDPYHGPGQAHGLSFSVPEGIPLPPSLVNIFKEIQMELGITCLPHGNLLRWARQGVLLLNSCLTVRKGQPASHKGQGWEEFTDSIIRKVSQKQQNLVFLLWGSFAIQKESLISSGSHLVLKSPHPSPLSAHRGFFGNGHFKKTNEFLISQGKEAIDWR